MDRCSLMAVRFTAGNPNKKENPDSDQSISEEEELDDNLPEGCISLGGPSGNKGGVQVLSQLEILRDAYELDHTTKRTILSQKRQIGFCIEDEVEIPVFDNESDFIRFPRRTSTCNSDEEFISDDEVKENNKLSTKSILGDDDFQNISLPSFGSIRKDGACTWSAATREAEALLHVNENAGCSSSHTGFSKTSRSGKGGGGKAKPKFSFHFQSPKDNLSWAIKNKDETHISSKIGNIEQSEIHAVPAEVAIGHGNTKHSMAELLDCFQDGLLQGNSKMYSRTKEFVVKRSKSPLGDRSMDGDDFPEAFDSASSSDDEDNHQNLKLIVPESKRKSMADQFQEALGAVSMNDEGLLFALPRKSGLGLFGRLQRVLQGEKEREMDFLKRVYTEASFNDKGTCIDVIILSMFLEAKLTVCRCSFVRDEESSRWVDNSKMRKEIGGRTSTIIFSSITCSDVDLEVGKRVHVHAPWKEVHVTGRKDEIIILSSYFSQIST